MNKHEREARRIAARAIITAVGIALAGLVIENLIWLLTT